MIHITTIYDLNRQGQITIDLTQVSAARRAVAAAMEANEAGHPTWISRVEWDEKSMKILGKSWENAGKNRKMLGKA